MKPNKTIYILLLFLLFNCKEQEVKTVLIKDNNFTLPIGNMDNELDFFSREGVSFSLRSDIFMKDGIFYIANGNGKKIMKFTSYGDLLNIIRPAGYLDSNTGSDSSWSFNEPGHMTINSDDYIYIEDKKEYELAFEDEYINKSYDTTEDKSDVSRHILEERIISIFDNNGEYINFIGQDGLAGKPFPFINDIFTDSKDRLVVVCQTTYFWVVYRYDSKGNFIDQHTIHLDKLPSIESEGEIITQLNNIIPDREKDRLLVELTFYQKIFDEKTGAIVSMDLITSRIYYYDLINDNYISYMEIPSDKDADTQEIQNYFLLDIIKGKYLFFLSQTLDGSGQNLIITNENGFRIDNVDMGIDNSSLIYTSYYLTSEGIITALLCTEYAGAVCSWRTDKILLEDSK